MKRPLLIYGAGVRGCVREAEELRRMTGIPLVVTWAVRDLFPYAEGFGTHGSRAANFAVQTADYILAVGTRLDTKATGSPASSFAPLAKLVMVDIDQAELNKMALIGRPLFRGFCVDSGAYIRALLNELHGESLPDWSAWRAKIEDWRVRFPAILPEYEVEETINPYVLMGQLSDLMQPDDVLVSDTGCGLAWIMQAFRFRGQRFVHALNNTPMGYGLPAAVGAAFATGRRVVLVTGDGGFGVNITELATVARHNLPIKIILLNNQGHQMCRQTQRQWLGGEYPGTSYEGGLATPDFVRIARAYQLPGAVREWLAEQVPGALRDWLAEPGPGFLECEIPVESGVAPMVRFGQPIENADPEIPDVQAILREAL